MNEWSATRLAKSSACSRATPQFREPTGSPGTPHPMGHSPRPHEMLQCCTWDPVSLSPAGRGICPRAQRAVNQLHPPNECSISEVRTDAPAWELTALPESGVCRKTRADTHHAAPGASLRVHVGCIAWGEQWDTQNPESLGCQGCGDAPWEAQCRLPPLSLPSLLPLPCVHSLARAYHVSTQNTP